MCKVKLAPIPSFQHTKFPQIFLPFCIQHHIQNPFLKLILGSKKLAKLALDKEFQVYAQHSAVYFAVFYSKWKTKEIIQ